MQLIQSDCWERSMARGEANDSLVCYKGPSLNVTQAFVLKAVGSCASILSRAVTCWHSSRIPAAVTWETV